MHYCGKCGKIISDNAIFCTECGCRLINTEPIEEDNVEWTTGFQPTYTAKNESNGIIIAVVVSIFVVLVALFIIVYFTFFRSKATAEKIGQAYVMTFEQFLPIEEMLPRNLYYTLYDIDKNNIPELIIQDYYTAVESTYHIYTYDDGKASYIGNYQGVRSGLREYRGNGFVLFSATGGTGVMHLFSIDNGTLSRVMSIDVTPQNYRDPGDVFEGAEKQIEFYSYHDAPNSYIDNIYRSLNLYSNGNLSYPEDSIWNYVDLFGS